MISKSLSTSERRARLNDVAGRLAEFCQAVYPLMVVHADDFGRHAGDPFTVKHVIDPTSRRTLDEFARALTFLDEVGLIHWYAVDDRQFYQVIDFDQHQSGLHKRTKSLIPEPPGNSRNPPEIPAELKGTEEKRTKKEIGVGVVPQTATATTTTPLVMNSLQHAKAMQTHVFVGTRLKVPNKLHDDFRRLLGGYMPDQRLLPWYHDVDAEIEMSGEPIVPDVFKWLEARFRVWASSTATDAAMRAWVEAG